MSPTLLGVGAHYDDCVFGVGGIMLQAVRKHYRVVVVSIIGDYSNWAPAQGRETTFTSAAAALAKEHGVEMRFLSFASQRFTVSEETRRALARVVAEVRPDVALALWDRDHHHDHVVASALSSSVLRQAGQVLGDASYRAPRSIYLYDNGPRHTIGFEPDTFVDVSDVWNDAHRWLGKLMAITRNQPYDAARVDPAQTMKESLARYRGATCGVSHAEALKATVARPQQIL